MANNDKLPYLSEIIDLERDILPHRVVLLHAGVGAGKNTWTKTLAQKGYRILLITSRRVTADVQAKNLDADKKIDIDRLLDLDDVWGEIAPDVQKRVVCTNSQIENFVKNKYILVNHLRWKGIPYPLAKDRDCKILFSDNEEQEIRAVTISACARFLFLL